ncbi:MAG: hypothetical protein S4CHLAM6_13480 [Chlamydiae bacterium]|nr:hypothetical protein [Chlamydiota bacterium]
MVNYWLMKCEPSAYSIDDLKNEKTAFWEGVRNYQARNFMRDQMKKGDLAFFYHSNAKPSGIVGLMEIQREGYPDHTARDPDSKYYDAKASEEKPIWFMVDVKFIKKFHKVISLDDLRATDKLDDMIVLKKGSRLSIQPVTEGEFNQIMRTHGH